MPTRDTLQTLLDGMARLYAAGDAAGCAAMFAKNARLHSPFAPPAIGRDQIEALHRDWTADAGDKSFEIVDWGHRDTLAWCLCRYREDGGASGGSSLIVLERDNAGDWLIRSCCLHDDPVAS